MMLLLISLLCIQGLHRVEGTTSEIQSGTRVNKEDILARLSFSLIDTNITIGGARLDNGKDIREEDDDYNLVPQRKASDQSMGSYRNGNRVHFPLTPSRQPNILDREDRYIALGNLSLWETRLEDIVHIPYVLDRAYDEADEGLILQAMREIAGESHVVEFVRRREGERDYIFILDGKSCSSHIGRIGGRQNLSLNRDQCMKIPVIKNELTHALGIWKHKNQDDDSDVYLKQSVDLDRYKMRRRLSDYSIMHYGHDDIIRDDTKIAQVDRDAVRSIQQHYQCTRGRQAPLHMQSGQCSPECKCWENQKGCSSDASCQGSLKCVSNTCLRDEFFFIESTQTGKVLDLQGDQCNDRDKVTLRLWTGSPTQRFYHGPDGTIMSVACQKALTMLPPNHFQDVHIEGLSSVNTRTCIEGSDIGLAKRTGRYDQRLVIRSEHGVIQSEECDTVFHNSEGSSQDGDAVIMWSYNAGSNQGFIVHNYNMNRPFFIQNRVTGKYITVENHRCGEGIKIEQYTYMASRSQMFYHGANGSIVSVLCDMPLDMEDGKCDNGTNIILGSKHFSDSQRFEFKSDGSIFHQHCKIVIDNKGGSHKDGNRIYAWEHNKRIGARQSWRIHH